MQPAEQAIVKSMILAIVSDDFEDLTHILAQLNRERSVVCTKTDIAPLIAQLYDEGLIQTFRLSPNEPLATEVPLGVQPWSNRWFYISNDGRLRVEGIDDLRALLKKTTA
jgi:hypothetical protein